MEPKLTTLRITGTPTAEQALTVWREVFPAPGVYQVRHPRPLLKAAGEDTSPFETWFLEALERQAGADFINGRTAIWRVLDDYLTARGAVVPSDLDWADLAQTLFDLSHCSTARMVGIAVRPDVAERLRKIGFTIPEILDFPGLAYRMGVAYTALQAQPMLPFPELRALVSSYPMTRTETAAIEHARAHAGNYLRPIYDDAGRVWTAQREIEPLRDLTARMIQERRSPLEGARELGRSQRAQGIVRDAQRVMRTEMATARAQGAWQARVREAGVSGDALMYRIPSPTACKTCLALYLDERGQPRRYTVAQLEGFDPGYNAGPTAGWVPKIGATHPHCVCGPWLRDYGGGVVAADGNSTGGNESRAA